MAAIVHGTIIKKVKNLGWVLRNWRKVKSLEFNLFSASLQHDTMVDGLFIANMEDGGIFKAGYASFAIFLGWIDRPVFRGLPIKVGSFTWNVGDEFHKMTRKSNRY